MDHTLLIEGINEDILPVVASKGIMESLKESNGTMQMGNETAEVSGSPEVVVELDDGREVIGIKAIHVYRIRRNKRPGRLQNYSD